MAEAEQDQSMNAGTSRRAALKAGVAAGIGLAAWTGPTITSIGGTPAYAATCTNFTVDQFVTNDRNTSQGCNAEPNSVGFHDIEVPLPANYSLDFGIGNSFDCNYDPISTTFTFPALTTCSVTVRLHDPQGFNTPPYYYDSTVTGNTGAMTVTLPSNTMYAITPPSGVKYSIRVRCLPTSAANCDL